MRRRGRDRGGFLLGTVAIAALWILALGAASAQAEFGIVNFDGERVGPTDKRGGTSCKCDHVTPTKSHLRTRFQ